MEIRSLTQVDISSIWEINEQGLPGTGKVSPEDKLEGYLESQKMFSIKVK